MSWVPENGRYNSWAGNPNGNPRIEVRCWEEVHESGRGALHYQCRRKWTVEYEGKRYCKQHDPRAVQAKHEKREQQYREEAAYRDRKWKRQAAERELIEAAVMWYHGGDPGSDRSVALAAAVEVLLPLRDRA